MIDNVSVKPFGRALPGVEAFFTPGQWLAEKDGSEWAARQVSMLFRVQVGGIFYTWHEEGGKVARSVNDVKKTR
jgi:hypothetical protein